MPRMVRKRKLMVEVATKKTLLVIIINFLRNVFLILIFFCLFFYQKDEPAEMNTTTFSHANYLDKHLENSLKDRIHIGLSKQSLIKLQQSTSDSRQL